VTISIDEGIVLKEGTPVAVYNEARGTVTSPARLTKKLAQAITEQVGKAVAFVVAEEEAGEEPAMDPARGDKTPAYVRWYRATHTAEEFARKYNNRTFTEESL